MERLNLYVLYEITSKLEVDKANSYLNLLQDINYVKFQIHEFKTLDKIINLDK